MVCLLVKRCRTGIVVVVERQLAWRAGEAWMERDVLGVMDGSNYMGNGRKQVEQQVMRVVLEVSVGREVAGAERGKLVKQEQLGRCMWKENHFGDASDGASSPVGPGIRPAWVVDRPGRPVGVLGCKLA